MTERKMSVTIVGIRNNKRIYNIINTILYIIYTIRTIFIGKSFRSLRRIGTFGN